MTQLKQHHQITTTAYYMSTSGVCLYRQTSLLKYIVD